MSVYKLLHKPTGLYYIPSRDVVATIDGLRRRVKSNLSKTGKIYSRRPPIPTGIYNHTQLMVSGPSNWPRVTSVMTRTTVDDWEIIEL